MLSTPGHAVVKALATMLFAIGFCCAESSAPALFPNEFFADDFTTGLSPKWKLTFKPVTQVKDGVLIAAMPDNGEHASGYCAHFDNTADFDLAFSFMLDGLKLFSVTVNDTNYDEAHAGHICKWDFKAKEIGIEDQKYGAMLNEYFKKEKTPEIKKLLATKRKTFSADLKDGTWYKARLRIVGDVMSAYIDEKEVGSFKSEGFKHATKNKVTFAVPGKYAHFDNVTFRKP